MNELSCKKCNKTWRSRKKSVPDKCPKCKTKEWFDIYPNVEPLTSSVCGICGHRWVARMDIPISCPKCQSRKWNRKGK